MNDIEKTIFERAYQSYLCGSDKYTYKFQSSNPNMIRKYEKALKNLEDEGFITINLRSEDRAKITVTEKGIDYGNLSI